MIRALLCILAFLPGLAFAQQNAANSTPGTPASQATQVQGCAACTPVPSFINGSNASNAQSPSGNSVSALDPDPGGVLTSGAAYDQTAGCAVYKGSTGNTWDIDALVTGLQPSGHTYWLLLIDGTLPLASPTTLPNGTQTGHAPGLLTAPWPLANGVRITWEHQFPRDFFNGAMLCITDSTAPQTFVLPSPQVPNAGVSLFMGLK